MSKLIKWMIIILFTLMVLWAFDHGMRRQHAIDCASGHYCADGV